MRDVSKRGGGGSFQKNNLMALVNFGENLFDSNRDFKVAKTEKVLQNHKHVLQLLGHDVLGGYLLEKHSHAGVCYLPSINAIGGP